MTICKLQARFRSIVLVNHTIVASNYSYIVCSIIQIFGEHGFMNVRELLVAASCTRCYVARNIFYGFFIGEKNKTIS